MKILFIHPNFPGQFKHLAQYFAAAPHNKVVFACRFPNNITINNVIKHIVTPASYKKNPQTHNYLQDFEVATLYAQSMFRSLSSLKDEGFIPDIIYAHPGWGDGMLIKEVFPESKYIAYMEFFYRSRGADIGFSTSGKVSYNQMAKTRIRNTTNLINMEAADWLISPTKWQASLHPKAFNYKHSIIHEGVDIGLINPIKIKNDILSELNIPNDAEIITYCARNLEPYRGFDIAMRAFEIICNSRPKAHFIIVGGDGVSYGAKLANGNSYKKQMLQEVSIDNSRFHWLGKIAFDKYLQVLKSSMAHLYLTYPFVLSWSFHEAMAMECPMVVSNTAPVLEVAEDNHTALIANFFSPKEIATKLTQLLEDRQLSRKLGKNARLKIIAEYSTDKILPEYVKLIQDIANRSL